MNEELDFYIKKENFDAINPVLKEIHKHMRCLLPLRDKGVQIFTEQDAKTLVDRMKGIVDLIIQDKSTRVEKIKGMKAKLDEEDMEYFMEDLEKVDKGLHHIMEITGILLQNMGKVDSVNEHVANTLLPVYAQVLQEVDTRKDYELIDSVCFICDCMEHGNDALFQKIVPHAGPVLHKVIQKAAADQDDMNFDLLYSSIFGLGVVARRIPNGQFAELQQTLEVLKRTTADMVAGKESELDEDEKDKRYMLRDNSISCLGKIVMF